MYNKIAGGSKVMIDSNAGYSIPVYVPPFGYGFNWINGEVEKTDVIMSSRNTKQQVWQRTELPKDWLKDRAVEIERQKLNAEYINSDLERFREQEWNRRFRGVWIYLNGIQTYITGSHYMYLNWWRLDDGYPSYRDCDRRRYYFETYCMEDPRCAGMLEASNRRSGKCFAKGTRIRMYDSSIKNVEDIGEGELVMGDDSTAREVFGLVNGVEEMFEITPNRGNSFVCNKSHILTLVWNGRFDHAKYFVAKRHEVVEMTIEKYLEMPFWVKDHLVLYKKGWGDNFKSKEHEIPPYILGLWLGDGCSTFGSITTADEEIKLSFEDYIKSLGMSLTFDGKYGYKPVSYNGTSNNSKTIVNYSTHTEVYESIKEADIAIRNKFGRKWRKNICTVENPNRRTNLFRDKLKSYNLLHNKHIPYEYLIDSKENRLELLAGLIDTDGHLTIKKGNPCGYEITQKNKELSSQILELARSLGFSCSHNKKMATMKRKDGSIYKCEVYRITIAGNNHIPCKIARKIKPIKETRVDQLRTGFKVKSVGLGEYYGFAVDKNHLFLLDDGIVVHNSFRSGLFLFDYVSITSDSMGGMQSKTGDDAGRFFRGKLVTPFKRLPDFFQPEIDESSGSKMTKEIRFTKTTKRGKGASKDMSELGQNAFLNYKASEVYGYDGEKLHRYVADEVGKPSDADIYERHTVVKYCLRVGKKWIGKALYTTTPETIEGIDMDDYPFKKLWEESDFNKRDGNHHTDSGLYRYLIPADETLECDIYGMPLLKDNRTYIQHTRAAAKAKSYKKYLTEIKKNPLTVQEMFMPSLEKSGIYNTEKLAERLDYLQWNKSITTRGNLVWEGGVRDSKVVYQANKTGKFNFAWKPTEENANNVEKRGNIWLPKNKLQFICGLDPFDHDVNNDERRSNAAAYIFKKNNPASTDPYNNAFVVEYINRPATAALMYEDILMLCVFFGCEVLYENQKPGIKRYFSDRGYEKFLVKLPQYDDYGIPSTPANKQTLAEVTEDYIENYIEIVFFPRLIQDWLMFDIKETQKYDAGMAAGWTLVGNMSTLIRKVVSELRPVTDYFRKRRM